MRTKSCALLEKYLEDRNLRFDYEPFPKGRNPDYKIKIDDKPVAICELKDIEEYYEQKRSYDISTIFRKKLSGLKLGFAVSVYAEKDINEKDISFIAQFIGHNKSVGAPEGAKLIFLLPQDCEYPVRPVFIDRIEDGKVIERCVAPKTKSNKYPIPLMRNDCLGRKCVIRIADMATEHLEWDITSHAEARIRVEKAYDGSDSIIGPTHCMWIANHEHIRNSVKKASKQLREHKHLKLPLAVVLFNRSSFHIDDEDVKTAMLGDATFRVSVASNGNQEPEPTRNVYGKGGIIQPKLNRSISAICMLDDLSSEGVRLRIFHNCWSIIKLPEELFNGPKDEHNILSLKSGRFTRITP